MKGYLGVISEEQVIRTLDAVIFVLVILGIVGVIIADNQNVILTGIGLVGLAAIVYGIRALHVQSVIRTKNSVVLLKLMQEMADNFTREMDLVNGLASFDVDED